MMSTSLFQKWALAAICLLLAACTASDQPDNSNGYAALKLSPESSTSTRRSADVVEFFMYSCRHCHALDAPLNAWVRERRGTHFERVPSAFSARDVPLQRLYFAVQALPNPEALHRSIFNAIHVQKLSFESEGSIADFMVRQGIERAAFVAAYHAPSVQQQIDHALGLRHRYAIRGVPAIVVADRFLTSPAMMQGSSSTADTSQPIEQATIRMLDHLLTQVGALSSAPAERDQGAHGIDVIAGKDRTATDRTTR